MLRTSLLFAAIASGFLAFGAAAQPGPGMGGMAGMQGMGPMSGAGSRECGKARDPQRCEALQRAKESCKDKAGTEKRDCIQSAMPPVDCSKARHPDRCEAHQKAKEACKDKVGKERRQCIRAQMPKSAKAGKN